MIWIRSVLSGADAHGVKHVRRAFHHVRFGRADTSARTAPAALNREDHQLIALTLNVDLTVGQ